MEPVIICSKTNTKLKTVSWGVFFIIFGLALEAGVIALCVTMDSAIYLIGLFVFAPIIWAGSVSIKSGKYPVILSADDKGIHYFVYSNRLGYSKKEIVLPWKEIEDIRGEFSGNFEENIAVQIELKKERDKTVISLDDTKITSETIADVVSKLNEAREFYSMKGV